jgi:hypothetical protein
LDTLGIEAEPHAADQKITSLKLTFGQTYILKARVEDTPDGKRYSYKIWNKKDAEPTAWTLIRDTPGKSAGKKALDHGSFLLVLHRVDATFGNITIHPAH